MPIIQSVERALTILDLFNDQAKELKITDISKQMGLSKARSIRCSKPCSCTAISIRTRKTANTASA
ncbi:IclR helix-turn-helix domain [Raoultella terrigena]|uniref:IclR helix-turn-helix domain n=1 Tax=Raoultella terrigena TaxID=577 RepID=A0A4U9D7C4_RAOTE|nr:IclR helix-turn-helix domain [Raoultella terrigena]